MYSFPNCVLMEKTNLEQNVYFAHGSSPSLALFPEVLIEQIHYVSPGFMTQRFSN